MAVLTDPLREFVSSSFVRLEVVPKATFFKRDAEVEFYEEYFSTLAIWAEFDETAMQGCMEEACRAGLSAVDAIHIELAARTECEELVTTERTGKPIHRTRRVRTVTIDVD